MSRLRYAGLYVARCMPQGQDRLESGAKSEGFFCPSKGRLTVIFGSHKNKKLPASDRTALPTRCVQGGDAFCVLGFYCCGVLPQIRSSSPIFGRLGHFL